MYLFVGGVYLLSQEARAPQGLPKAKEQVMPNLKVSDAFQKLAEQVADEREVTVTDACDIIGEVAVARWNAVRKHTAKKKAAREAAQNVPTEEPKEPANG